MQDSLKNPVEITVLCKVVDNFGDIGVAWRMIKQLQFRMKSGLWAWAIDAKINLVIDDLISFNKINHFINPQKTFQVVDKINIYDWNAYDYCYNEFSGNWDKLQIILECFQCGRPDWMEKILFEDGLEKAVHIIMIDYLTAEDYAEDFHLLNSLTRSAKVQKINFMPGFTEKTGGLLIDSEWEKPVDWNKDGPCLVFTYEKNWKGTGLGLARGVMELNCNKKILVAQGRGKESFINSCQSIPNIFIKELPYLDQRDWDKQMKDASVLFIRGEESMSRACLSGIPFVWHAYPQSDEYQLVKVNALLSKLKPYFDEELYSVIEKVWILFNTPDDDKNYQREIEAAVYDFIKNKEKMVQGFKEFSNRLRKNGDLAINLMTFINKNYIIEDKN